MSPITRVKHLLFGNPLNPFNPGIKTLSVTLPEKKRAGVRLESVVELVDRLKNEAQVI